MKKSLYFAFLLLTLLAVTHAKAQNYSSEMGGTCNGTGIWCRALNSDADIYTEVYDESAYEFNDYSEYGDFSQEVVFNNGIRYLYGFDDYNSNNMASSTVAYGGNNVSSLSKYDTTKLRDKHLYVVSNGDAYTTLRNVLDFMLQRTQQTKTETAAVSLESGNYVIYKDKGNTWNSANVYYDRDKTNGTVYCFDEVITNFYHTHPYVNMGRSNNPLYISQEDQNVVNHLNLDYINILAPDGTLYSVDPYDWNDIAERFNIYE